MVNYRKLISFSKWTSMDHTVILVMWLIPAEFLVFVMYSMFEVQVLQ